MKNLTAIVLTCLLCACCGDNDMTYPEPSNCDSGDAGREETGTATHLCDDFLVPPCMIAALVNGECVAFPERDGTQCPITSGPNGISFGTCDHGVCRAPCEGDACNVAAFVDGQCVITPIPGCSFCATAGTKRDGQSICCVGCWAGESCRTEPDELACGVQGSLCIPCDGTKQCVDGACK
jgi:hypothetical protein